MANSNVIIGPWGRTDGEEWDDGSYAGVQSIVLSHGYAIGTFNVIYYSNNKLVPGPRHDSNKPYEQTTIVFEKDEQIVKVSGYTGAVPGSNSTPVVRSLTFTTKKPNAAEEKIYGPYGIEEGSPFNIPIQNGIIVGFKGKSSDFLEAIGLRLAV